jgi:xanthine/uracil permease
MAPQQSVHPVDEVLPVRLLISFGMQHVLVMYAGAVAVPLILGSALGLTAAQMVTLINANLLTSGVATMIQTVGVWQFGARLPLIQGSASSMASAIFSVPSSPAGRSRSRWRRSSAGCCVSFHPW